MPPFPLERHQASVPIHTRTADSRRRDAAQAPFGMMANSAAETLASSANRGERCCCRYRPRRRSTTRGAAHHVSTLARAARHACCSSSARKNDAPLLVPRDGVAPPPCCLLCAWRARHCCVGIRAVATPPWAVCCIRRARRPRILAACRRWISAQAQLCFCCSLAADQAARLHSNHGSPPAQMLPLLQEQAVPEVAVLPRCPGLQDSVRNKPRF